jgi:beta-barrel assembly-enhancing protease
VLGHELGHVSARHSAEQMKKAMYANMGLGLLGSLFGNRTGIGVTLAKMGAELGASAGMMKFSRDDERQADQIGLQTVYDAGYDPMGMITFFEKLEQKSKASPSKLQLFFSTHPNSAERVANISKQMKALPARQKPIVTTSEFKNMKKRLAKLPPSPPPKPQPAADNSGKQ